ncbi:hypothetical protein F2Q69_00016765 [Brassica cretica]|uniref:Uncharacterized protein n=1 Tax=Brassica cretica TaxID=69181 RepID=A0A8S9R8I8_BRACR|nr:hypothetical protein F2Q69_00016765 [Brassica cretica]
MSGGEVKQLATYDLERHSTRLARFSATYCGRVRTCHSSITWRENSSDHCRRAVSCRQAPIQILPSNTEVLIEEHRLNLIEKVTNPTI